MSPRPRMSRLRRASLAALVTAAVAVPVSGAAGPADVPAPVPTVSGLPAAATPAALTERYAATRADIGAAARSAGRHGDTRRAHALRAMASPGRRFLSFDGRYGGRTVEVVGDLSTAERIAVLVPGAGVSVDDYWRLRNEAAALHRQLGDPTAVVAWLGYRAPASMSLAEITTARAEEAAPGLRRFVDALHRLKPAARTSLVCHSYGSVVCARAAAGLPVAALVLTGSPGTGYRTVGDLHAGAEVWAGRSSGDWIANVPHLSLHLPFVTLGFGTDPVSPEFGAEVFAAGGGTHSDYLTAGSTALANIARIVNGLRPEVPHA
ncbi:alpha/beta hydrolase [Streptomyces sp. TS71-3]|uniref:alpha/beta hydrolase n=1 Tax=Streptomyces sp. TS71-3 TaxID=2733862 RepID=UPI001B23F783|nr:alpha/beta hydrolase [Streptomyces sp. TS71-3]GHJ42017.1 hypothetical protein Sm713_76260 [Streptomyces sp. TS71-3]